MWRYQALCGGVRRGVAMWGVTLGYLVLCGVIWCYVALVLYVALYGLCGVMWRNEPL